MSTEADPDRPRRQLAALPLREPELPNSNAEREAAALQDRTTMAEIKSDLAFIHSQLGQINSAIVAIQTHNLRQTGGVALALSVLIVIAWKLIGG